MNNEHWKQFENLPTRKADTVSTPYTDKFEKWSEEARNKGLLYVNVFYGDTSNMTYESFCEEFIRMHEAPTLPDPEVLGEFSPK